VYKILLEGAAEKDLGRLSHEIHDRSLKPLKHWRIIRGRPVAGNLRERKTTGASVWAIIASFMKLRTLFASCACIVSGTGAKFIGENLEMAEVEACRAAARRRRVTRL